MNFSTYFVVVWFVVVAVEAKSVNEVVSGTEVSGKEAAAQDSADIIRIRIVFIVSIEQASQLARLAR